MEEVEDGHYEQVGDVQEWRWAEGKEPRVGVPAGEFDPRSAPNPNLPEPPPAPKTETRKSRRRKAK